ncbi:aconitate hydratase [Candidatus Micrarchaeota archaeon]|nr:aconitate hydratase [Candidatus Micrarchaeota archaeon]
MGMNLTHKIISEHLVDGQMVVGEEIGIKVDQTLTQDATGTMSFLQFEALGLPRVQTEVAVSYVDHNMLQTSFENADDHRYLQSVAQKYGVYFSRPGNGICHQVHLERFSVPGKFMLGSDSHTPTCGGMGMLAIGAGGLDVAVAMGGGPFYTKMPKVLGIQLKGKLQRHVAAKDIILEVLRRLTVKGGVGKVIEYYGEGVKSLDVYQRSTITNMGAELGSTTSIFPTDEKTREFLKRQGREDAYQEVGPDADATYDEHLEIDLNTLEPLIAKPQSPDNVVPVREVEGLAVQQVLVGSCTNSSLKDLMTVATYLKGKKVHSDVSMALSPGSKQVFQEIARNGALADFINAGVRVLESACGPCIGMGQAPGSDMVSLRTFNRNFAGRSGTKNDKVYLCSPEVAVASAITGKVTDPRSLPDLAIHVPTEIVIDDSMILAPSDDPDSVEVLRGPNIKPVPLKEPVTNALDGVVLIKTGDNVTTDHIMPAGAKILPLRSNVPAISEFVFCNVDADFVKRAKENHGGFIVGGENYGQGSSREHAALAPMYLGVKAVFAKNFARIHKDNLVNFGIVPLEIDGSTYDDLQQGHVLSMEGVREALELGSTSVELANSSSKKKYAAKLNLTPRQRHIILAGGTLNWTRANAPQASLA